MKFNEVFAITRKVASIPQAIKAKMDTIEVNASPDKRFWGGLSAAEANQVLLELYEIGDIVKAHYVVTFAPYNGNATKSLPIFEDTLTPFLVTETNLPVVSAAYNEVQVGGFFYRSLQSMIEPDLQMTLIETRSARILTSMLLWRELAENSDGTFNPPASYALECTIGLFTREGGRANTSFERKFLVGPNLAAIDDLAAREFSSAEIPLTLTPLRPHE